ncbi:Malate/L-lactate dehydrogenase family protein (plasmid) [Mesorhizobium loti]|nr:Malate/L-lactate dehydrogenase family protein [Mesorhizobium loti]
MRLPCAANGIQFDRIVHNWYEAVRSIVFAIPRKLITKNRNCRANVGRSQKQRFVQIADEEQIASGVNERACNLNQAKPVGVAFDDSGYPYLWPNESRYSLKVRLNCAEIDFEYNIGRSYRGQHALLSTVLGSRFEAPQFVGRHVSRYIKGLVALNTSRHTSASISFDNDICR